MAIDLTAYQTRIGLMCVEAIAQSKVMPDPLLASSQPPWWIVNIFSAKVTGRVNSNVVNRKVSAELILVRGGVDASSHGAQYTQLLTDGGTVLTYFETNRSLILASQTRVNMIAGMMPGTVEIDLDSTGTIPVVAQGVTKDFRGTRYILTWAIQNRTTTINV